MKDSSTMIQPATQNRPAMNNTPITALYRVVRGGVVLEERVVLRRDAEPEKP